MVVNDERKWCFFAIPKCASCTLQHPYDGGVLLQPHFGGRFVGRDGPDWYHDAHAAAVPDGYLSFAVVRSPFDRVVSLFRHYSYLHPDAECVADFAAFVRGVHAGEVHDGHPVWNDTQAEWLARTPRHKVDFLLRLDRLQTDLFRVGVHDEWSHLPKLNQYPGREARWTPELVGLVKDWAVADFDLRPTWDT
jgi:hypothetical protein